jgi:hypothetical protein
VQTLVSMQETRELNPLRVDPAAYALPSTYPTVISPKEKQRPELYGRVMSSS